MMKILIFKNITIDISDLVFLEYNVRCGGIDFWLPHNQLTLYYCDDSERHVFTRHYKEFASILNSIGEVKFMNKVKTIIDSFILDNNAFFLDLYTEIYNYLNEIKSKGVK